MRCTLKHHRFSQMGITYLLKYTGSELNSGFKVASFPDWPMMSFKVTAEDLNAYVQRKRGEEKNRVVCI